MTRYTDKKAAKTVIATTKSSPKSPNSFLCVFFILYTLFFIFYVYNLSLIVYNLRLKNQCSAIAAFTTKRT